MHSLIKILTSLLLLLCIQTVNAGPWQDFGETFQSFIKKANSINKAIEKEYTTDQLSKFHSDLYSMQRHHEYMILMIQNPGMIDNNLSTSISALRKKANAGRNKLKRIGKKVPSLSKDIKKLRTQLYRSTHSKKIWPSRIRIQDIPDYHLEHYLLTEGKSALEITRASRKTLEAFLKNH